MSLTACVSGASGFVGSHLVRGLHGQGWDVHVLARRSSLLNEIEGVPVTVHLGDLSDYDSVRAAMPEPFDAVFHVAASTNFWAKNNRLQDRVNIDGTRNMLEAAAAAGVRRFIHTSSFTTWGFRNTELTEESARTGATDWINYVRSKYRAEQLVLDKASNRQMEAVILNPAHILGPGDQHNWSRMIRMVQQGKLFAAPPGSGNFCDVREVANAHIAAFHRGRSGEKYLLGGEYAAFADVVKIAGEVVGCKVPVKAAPAWIIRAWAHLNTITASFSGREPDVTPESAAMVSYHVNCNSGKARKELDYRFTPIRQLIEDTAAWMQRQGLLS
ncbi:MAG: SDR family oxidoreductase [Xanthomonadales bacterium]|nr:SDR family oxidoreductase [Gammaproteobacteria bacterium]MBT8052498.1 SDR family oxidoreductase [Gammaproteobacteria bacterium]NND57128.1 SDR family oxidoreductase [Xanthomonadales bacterium]NNK52778.1 SDR family oxidoreductase [Xanthomonadales bacterium]